MIKPDPPASLADTREAVERMDARGEHGRRRSTSEQVEEIVRDLVESGVETLTVALDQLVRERRARASRSARSSSASTRASRSRSPREVLPEFREYERALTACMNSYVRPKVADYVNRLQEQLTGIGAKADVNILRSDAGLMTTREAARNPIYGVLSGPVRAASPARCSSRARRATTTSSRSTWAGRRPTSRSARTASRRSAARRRSATSGSRCRPSTCTRSARAAARSRTCPS